ncbi:MAG: 23S rRNA (guanosine(2251)-2'-O)-methyltransferase RlmB [Bifidobacteriaceae bacterium]|jgi:23S rRNA (guanosine2251-2'-O)-methyltransferase|nr:23S rRNA (guanosine(2251)-2'-O)-methyltransferase RlmB [Bifidobacteriaceae bacterium]
MAGNSRRPGAVRRPGTKKGPTVGSGGQGRQALEGRGPTPKAEDRPYHPAAKRKAPPGKGGPGKPAGRGARPAAKSASESVAGRNAVLEALRAGVPATRLEIASRADSDPRLREIVGLAADRGIAVLEVSLRELDRRTDARHQGVVLQVPPYQYAAPADLLRAADDAASVPFVVALDSVTDPHNLGAILRSAAAFGADGLVIPTRRAAGVTAAAWKVSAGAAARLPVARVTNLVRALEEFKKAGCYVIGLDADGGERVGGHDLLTEPLVVVVGSEGKGLARLVRQTCDVIASIPIRSGTESLNASVAAGIALHEVARARARR